MALPFTNLKKLGFHHNGYTLNMEDLQPRFAFALNLAGKTTEEILKDMGLVKNTLDGIKVLGNGKLEKKLTVKANKFSASAFEQIEKLGGKAEVI